MYMINLENNLKTLRNPSKNLEKTIEYFDKMKTQYNSFQNKQNDVLINVRNLCMKVKIF